MATGDAYNSRPVGVLVRDGEGGERPQAGTAAGTGTATTATATATTASATTMAAATSTTTPFFCVSARNPGQVVRNQYGRCRQNCANCNSQHKLVHVHIDLRLFLQVER